MLGLMGWVEIIKAILQFPSTILEFVRILKKTPQEKHEDLLKKISEEARQFEDTGRPTW